MPDHHRSGDRTAGQRGADHEAIARLADRLVPALVAKLAAANLGEVEIREGDWRIRVRRPPAAAPRRERPHRAALPIVAPAGAASSAQGTAATAAASTDDPDGPEQAAALSPAVGMFKAGVPTGTRVRAGDRIAAVDLLGIAVDVVAPIDGTVVEIYPQSGDGVEYGEPIALVEAEAAAAGAPAVAAVARPERAGEG